MRFALRYLSLAAFATLSLSACNDHRDLLAPKPNDILVSPYPIPLRPPPLQLNFLVDIVAGDYHTCVRYHNGSVSCWGWDDSGQSGVLSTTFCGSGIHCVPQPAKVTGTTNFTSAKAIAAGSQHTCALDGSGAAWCWGDDHFGQLGDGLGGYRTSPIPVAGFTFASVGSSNNRTCASSTAGGLFCWGSLGSTQTPATPMFVASGSYSALAVANDHTCGRDANNSNAWLCFGSNSSGQLGFDPAQVPSIVPPQTIAPAVVFGSSHVAVASGITCDDQATSVQCFGQNIIPINEWPWWLPLLGNPQDTNQFSFQPQTAGAFHDVAVSTTHVCALDASGNAWCWGTGDYGALGNNSGAPQFSAAPVMVAGGHTFNALAVGLQHSCGIGTDGHVYCWGDNYYGQLGVGVPGPQIPWYATSPVQTRDPQP